MGARNTKIDDRRGGVHDGARQPTLAERVRAQTGCAWSRARALCTAGRVTVDGERCVDPAARVDPSQSVVVDAAAPKVRARPLPRSAVLYVDRDVVVVDKPVGMLSVADEAGNRDTLADHTRGLLRTLEGPAGDGKLGVVHRLDKDTSGVMVFARTAQAKRALAERFRAHAIDRQYHAIVHGAVGACRVDTWLLLDRGDGLRGSHGHLRRATGGPPSGARRSVTHVTPIEALAGATLVECRLETGRQHQIRIHLAELGHPLLGERVYIRDYEGPIIPAPRTMLHARRLGFVHPRSGRPMSFEREPPADFQTLVASLRLGGT